MERITLNSLQCGTNLVLQVLSVLEEFLDTHLIAFVTEGQSWNRDGID